MNKFEWYVPQKPVDYDAEGNPLLEVLTEEERLERDCLKVTTLPLLKVPHDDKSILHRIEQVYQNTQMSKIDYKVVSLIWSNILLWNRI